jgi:hypothetical protein
VGAAATRALNGKSFLLLFFKKEELSFPSLKVTNAICA